MVTPRRQTEAERAEEERIGAKLANFGDRAGRHGPLAACMVKLSPRVSREANLRLINLARQVEMRPAQLQALALDSISRIQAAEFFSVIADLRKRAN